MSFSHLVVTSFYNQFETRDHESLVLYRVQLTDRRFAPMIHVEFGF